VLLQGLLFRGRAADGQPADPPLRESPVPDLPSTHTGALPEPSPYGSGVRRTAADVPQHWALASSGEVSKCCLRLSPLEQTMHLQSASRCWDIAVSL
jgi:hypothetical protein